MRRSVGLLTATVGLLCALTVGGQAANVTLQKGQEFVYSGTGKFAYQTSTQRARSVKFAVQERRLVTESNPSGSKMAIVQEFTPEGGEGSEAGLKVAELNTSGVEKSSSPSGFQPTSLYYVFDAMPLVFAREVKEDDRWEASEKITLMTLPPVTFQVTYRVVGEENVGDMACWKVEKTLNESLPSTRSIAGGTAEMIYGSFVERWWVGKAQPLVARWERAMEVTYTQGNVSARYEHGWDIALQGQRTLPAEEMTAREEQWRAVQSIEAKLDAAEGGNLAQTVPALEGEVTAFKSKYPNSPFQALIPQIEEEIRELKQVASRPKTGLFSVVLPVLDTNRQVSLWDLRGKVILLNFFASW